MNGSMNRSTTWTSCLLAAALSLSPFAVFAQESRPAHPLDALTALELQQAKAILSQAGKLGPKARFHAVDLDEPDKSAVIAWRPGTSLLRRAVAVAKPGRCTRPSLTSRPAA